MVTLAQPFILCPLADNKELLGFSEDATENKVVITVGRNIAILYSLIDQSQLTSWTTSRHWYTSKVVYCKDQGKYAAVVDETYVFLWEENDVTLLNAMKVKFPVKVHAIVPTQNSGSLLIFQNGIVLPYAKGLADRKQLPNGIPFFDPDQWMILDHKVNEEENKVYIIVGKKPPGKVRSKCGKEKHEQLKIYVATLPFGSSETKEEKPQEHTVVTSTSTGSGHTILGWTLMVAPTETYLLYMSSDGFLYKYVLMNDQSGKVTAKEPFKLSTFDRYFSLSKPSLMFQQDDSTILCYGSDPAEEGSVVIVYDVKYDLMLCKQPLKLYNDPPIAAKVGTAVLVPLGLNILVVGVRSSKTLLSSVVGRHKLEQIDLFETKNPWKDGWEGVTADELEEKSKPSATDNDDNDVEDGEDTDDLGVDLEDLKGIAQSLERSGHPEALICAQIVPQAIRTKLNSNNIVKWVLDYFSEIPENYLLMLMLTLLPEEGDLKETSEDTIRQVLQRTFDRRAALKPIKKLEFTVAKRLLQTIVKIFNSANILTEYENVGNMIHWMGTIVDGQYSNFVYNNDSDTADEILTLVNNHFLVLREIETLSPMLKSILSKKSCSSKSKFSNNYRVDVLKFT